MGIIGHARGSDLRIFGAENQRWHTEGMRSGVACTICGRGGFRCQYARARSRGRTGAHAADALIDC